MQIKDLILFVSFTFLYFSLIGQSSFSTDLPIVFIETEGKTIYDSIRIQAKMGIVNNLNEKENYYNDKRNEYDGYISIEIRGNTSQSFPKKQYALETQFKNGENRNVSLLNMPKENDWILHAPYSDKSLMRNVLAYRLYSELGYYASRTHYCELFLNDEYQGIYILMEKLKKDKNRIDVESFDDDDDDDDDEITGGYVLRIDNAKGYECSVIHSHYSEQFLQVDYPDCEDLSEEQDEYIRKYIADFETALFSDEFKNPIIGYNKYIDNKTFIDYLLLQELSKNVDAYRLSTLLTKDKDAKLKMGPVWDFNIAFGNANYFNGWKSDSLYTHHYAWWNRLMEDEGFVNSMNARWKNLRKNQFSFQNINSIIDHYYNQLKDAQERDNNKWKTIGVPIWPNYSIGQTYEDEVNYLKNWIARRIVWMDNNLPGTNRSEDYTYSQAKLYPNPYHYYLTCDITLDEDGPIEITLYSIDGKLKATLLQNEYLTKGFHQLNFDAKIQAINLDPGIYYCIVKQNSKVLSREKILKY